MAVKTTEYLKGLNFLAHEAMILLLLWLLGTLFPLDGSVATLVETLALYRYELLAQWYSKDHLLS